MPGIGRGSQGISAVVCTSLKRVDRTAMLIVAQAPHQNDPDQCESSRNSASRAATPRSNFAVDQCRQCGQDKPEQQESEHHWLKNKNYIPRIPALRKRPERAHTVVIREIEQDVAQPLD